MGGKWGCGVGCGARGKAAGQAGVRAAVWQGMAGGAASEWCVCVCAVRCVLHERHRTPTGTHPPTHPHTHTAHLLRRVRKVHLKGGPGQQLLVAACVEGGRQAGREVGGGRWGAAAAGRKAGSGTTAATRPGDERAQKERNKRPQCTRAASQGSRPPQHREGKKQNHSSSQPGQPTHPAPTARRARWTWSRRRAPRPCAGPRSPHSTAGRAGKGVGVCVCGKAW